MKNKNIWIFNHYAITPDIPGGTRHFNLAKQLVKRGHNVTIFASSFIHGIFADKKLNNGEKWKVENFEGVNFVWIKTFPYKGNGWRRVVNMLSYSWRAYFLGRKIPYMENSIGKPDVIIGSSVHLFAVKTAQMLSALYKVPFVFEVRDIWPLTLIEIGGFAPNHPLVRIMDRIEKNAYKSAELVVSLLPNFELYLNENKIEVKKLLVLPNGICTDELMDDNESLPENIRRRIPEDKFIIVYTGTFGNANALEYLIRAAALLRDYKNICFLLIGKGPEEEKLKRMKRDLAVNNLDFIPSVPKKYVQKILSLCDVCYIGLRKVPIFRYGVSPNKLYEYMYSGKPVLYAVNSGNNPVDEAEAGIAVEAENPQAIADGVLKLYNMSEDKRRIMGENGKKYVIANHTFKKLAEKLEEGISMCFTNENIKQVKSF